MAGRKNACPRKILKRLGRPLVAGTDPRYAAAGGDRKQLALADIEGEPRARCLVFQRQSEPQLCFRRLERLGLGEKGLQLGEYVGLPLRSHVTADPRRHNEPRGSEHPCGARRAERGTGKQAIACQLQDDVVVNDLHAVQLAPPSTRSR